MTKAERVIKIHEQFDEVRALIRELEKDFENEVDKK